MFVYDPKLVYKIAANGVFAVDICCSSSNTASPRTSAKGRNPSQDVACSTRCSDRVECNSAHACNTQAQEVAIKSH